MYAKDVQSPVQINKDFLKFIWSGKKVLITNDIKIFCNIKAGEPIVFLVTSETMNNILKFLRPFKKCKFTQPQKPLPDPLGK